MAKAQGLSNKQHRALELYHLGGIDALCGNVACNTTGSLMRKGYFDRKGLTAKGVAYIEQHVIPDHTGG